MGWFMVGLMVGCIELDLCMAGTRKIFAGNGSSIKLGWLHWCNEWLDAYKYIWFERWMK